MHLTCLKDSQLLPILHMFSGKSSQADSGDAALTYRPTLYGQESV